MEALALFHVFLPFENWCCLHLPRGAVSVQGSQPDGQGLRHQDNWTRQGCQEHYWSKLGADFSLPDRLIWDISADCGKVYETPCALQASLLIHLQGWPRKKTNKFLNFFSLVLHLWTSFEIPFKTCTLKHNAYSLSKNMLNISYFMNKLSCHNNLLWNPKVFSLTNIYGRQCR